MRPLAALLVVIPLLAEVRIRYIKRNASEFLVDPSRLAPMGESAGGHLVGLAATLSAPGTKVAAVVPIDQSVKFQAQLRADGNQCQLFTVDGGIHGVINWEKNPRQHAYKEVLVDWLRKTLKVESPAPEPRTQ
jgi:acetyl esterase/lipase